MTSAPPPISVLLAAVARLGIELRACGDQIRYRPKSAMTPELAQRLTASKPEVLAVLNAHATYAAGEHRLLAGSSPVVLSVVENAKRAFANLGGLTVESVTDMDDDAHDAHDVSPCAPARTGAAQRDVVRSSAEGQVM